MAYIAKRGEYWRVEIKRQGHKPTYRTFDTQKEAKQWANRIEHEMDVGSYIDRSRFERTTLREALQKYLADVVPQKTHPKQEAQRVNSWLKNDLAYRTLGNLRGSDFAKYRDQRRNDGRAENTIRLELQLISHLFEKARTEWGMIGLANPLADIEKPSASSERNRRLHKGEYEKIRKYLSERRNKEVEFAFELAIETSLRRGMLLQLRWEWVDFEERLIHIPEKYRQAKNKGVPTEIPISTRTEAALRALWAIRCDVGPTVRVGPIFKSTGNAIHCIWKEMRTALGLSNLRWHDLRHEGTSRLFERGFHPLEAVVITGHKSMQTLKRYTHIDPQSLLEKLG